MRIAVSSRGTSLDGWVGTALDACAQFLVVDSETMDVVIVAIPAEAGRDQSQQRTLLQSVLRQGVEAVITGPLSETCRWAMQTLGIEVVENTQRMTVREAVALYLASGAPALAEYKPRPERIAVGSHGEGLEATLHARNEPCTSFVLVEPESMDYEVVRVKSAESLAEASVNAVRTAARSGATVVITSGIRPACCEALRALGITLIVADENLTVREAVRLYRQGTLKPS